MNDQFEQFISVLDALGKHKVEYILVGGVAVILHGIERLTGISISSLKWNKTISNDLEMHFTQSLMMNPSMKLPWKNYKNTPGHKDKQNAGTKI